MGNNWCSEFKKWLESDKLFNKNNFCLLVYEVNSQGKIRFNRNPFDSMLKFAPPDEVPQLTYWHRLLFRTSTVLGWLFMPSTPQQAAEILDAGFDRYDAMTRADFDWSKQPHKLDSLITRRNFRRLRFNFKYYAQLIADMEEEGHYKIHDLYLRNLALRRGSRLLVAIKQYQNEHGVWPPDLDAIKSTAPAEALADPQNGGPFVYKLTGETFTFYSKGKNGKDDQGRRSTSRSGGSDAPAPAEDDTLFWPPRR
jgi:hypothetical protein